MQTTYQFLTELLEHCSLPVGLDDNLSLKKEEHLAVMGFDGCSYATKGGGIKTKIGELLTTTNLLDAEVRAERLLSGRLCLLENRYRSFEENPNAFQSSKDKQQLTEHLNSTSKVNRKS